MFEYRPQPKPSHSKIEKPKKVTHNRSGKLTQKRRGAISPSVREEVRTRSKGLCEVRKRCTRSVAVHMAHLQSRNTIDSTTALDLLHACVECHMWMDTHEDGIKYKRMLRERDAG